MAELEENPHNCHVGAIDVNPATACSLANSENAARSNLASLTRVNRLIERLGVIECSDTFPALSGILSALTSYLCTDLAGQQLQGVCAHIIDGEAVFLEQPFGRRGSAKAFHAEHIALRANIAIPTLRHAQFHRKPRVNGWRKDRIAFGLGQSLE